MGAWSIRPATPDDGAILAALYEPHVLTGIVTFEEDAPDAAEMARRVEKITDAGLPWLIAEADDGTPLGYAYAGPYRERPAYRYSAENSIYLSEAASGKGLGTTLLAQIIDLTRQAGKRTMIAVIGDSNNAASIGLHRKMGFSHIGILKAVGHKFGQDVDTVIMQLDL